jgi:hypothetical protein
LSFCNEQKCKYVSYKQFFTAAAVQEIGFAPHPLKMDEKSSQKSIYSLLNLTLQNLNKLHLTLEVCTKPEWRVIKKPNTNLLNMMTYCSTFG